MRKKAGISLLAAVLLALPVYGADREAGQGLPGETEIEVRGSYVPGAGPREIYCVDITWDAMDFTYREAGELVWNPSGHIYEFRTEGAWSRDGGQIRLENHSSCPVAAGFTFHAAQALPKLTGSFDKEILKLPSAQGTAPREAPRGSTWLSLAGEAGPCLEKIETVGTVTVTIMQETREQGG